MRGNDGKIIDEKRIAGTGVVGGKPGRCIVVLRFPKALAVRDGTPVYVRDVAEVRDGAEDHPILKGVDVDELVGQGSLYKVSPLADSATPLLTGTIPGQSPEPVAWTNQNRYGGRTFYTSLGHVGDFEQPAFNRLLKNGIDWAVNGTSR